jgi:hypothetical protein
MKLKIPSGLFWLFAMLVITMQACNAKSTPTASSSIPITGATEISNPMTSVPTSLSSGLLQQGIAPVNLPEKLTDRADDINSSSTAAKKLAPPGSDIFVKNLFERPFNANAMDTYFPYIDIVNTQGYIDDTWGYATITLSGVDANGHLPAKYGVELDLNKDGRGDWLILVSNPSSTDWSTQGVQAWRDTNGDVGGKTPIVSDNSAGGNGYETLVFDQGKGSDNPDGAWDRISSADNKTIQIAFKLSMIGNPKFYTMGAWAGTDLNPAMFDYNDHITHLQAGDPDSNVQFYPIKALSEIDSTCRLIIPFDPAATAPGLCFTYVKPHNAPGSIPPPPPPGRNPNGG